MTHLRLGLIGDNIGASRAPRFHMLAGKQNGISVTYDRLVPQVMERDFDSLFDHVMAAGYRGINITYPYKERAATRVRIDDPGVRALGAVNTVLFDGEAPRGFNTDHSGFISAWSKVWGNVNPGTTLVIGAGGVGRAISFAIATLGAREIRLADTDLPRANRLAKALTEAFPALDVRVGANAAALAADAQGLVNATPVGMTGHPGTPLPPPAMRGALWAFDAVYTPINTQFLTDATSAGLNTLSGFELFIGQAVDAWNLFSERPIDEARLRADLAAEEIT
ncbi:shikimate dehydrogenase family protein [Roseinatronobacter alkalisoli]|uniref:Shikimate dehydrogenase n=1 Tax=Roseinatronobacter alkalisoli TaxID=3028235 RepID=A0ABT5TAX9_9RHOB|nr:shikimate dehydrogenase [Roseinatronobacter sp. HJB301]MDD7972267.1 shikimate dehydrogenase [Roseinatronobacter sp. HJB301]